MPRSGGTRVSSAVFLKNSLERQLCNIAFPLSSVYRFFRFCRKYLFQWLFSILPRFLYLVIFILYFSRFFSPFFLCEPFFTRTCCRSSIYRKSIAQYSAFSRAQSCKAYVPVISLSGYSWWKVNQSPTQTKLKALGITLGIAQSALHKAANQVRAGQSSTTQAGRQFCREPARRRAFTARCVLKTNEEIIFFRA